MITIPVFVVVTWGFVVLWWGLYICVVAVYGPALWCVGFSVVVLFENSIVCHLMKQTLFVYEHEREREHQ